MIPRNSVKTDWEVELGIVIGKRCSNVTEDEAGAHIFGYTCVDDVTAADINTIIRLRHFIRGDADSASAALTPAAQPRSCALSRAACRVRWSRSGRLGADRAAWA